MPNSGNIDQLDDVGFSIDGENWHWYHKIRGEGTDASTAGAAQAVIQTDTGPGEDLARPQRTWHRGSGYSRIPDAPELTQAVGVIDYMLPGDNRRERSILPPSKLEELPMPTVFNSRWTSTFEQEWVLGTPQPADFFALVDHYCYRLDVGSSIPVFDAYFSDAFTPLSAVNFGGPVYVGGDGGHSLFRREAGGIWHQSADFFPVNPVRRRYLALAKVRHGQEFADGAGTAGHRVLTLFGSIADGSGAIKWCEDDPLNPNAWHPGQGVALGLSNSQITYAFSAPSAVAFLKPEGVFLHNGTEDIHLTPYWFNDFDTYNSGIWGMFLGNAMLASHARFLDFVPYSFDLQRAPQKVTPGQTPLPNTSPVRGQVTSGTSFEGDPWVCMYSPSLNQSLVCMGGPTEIIAPQSEIQSPLVWNFAFQVIPGRVDVMAVTSKVRGSTASVPYMHFLASNAPGLSPADDQLKSRWFRCRVSSNPLMDPSYPFATHWVAYSPEDDLGEQYAGSTATTRGLAATSSGGDYGTFSVSVDGGEYIEQGQASSPGSSWQAEAQQTGRRFKWKFEGRGWQDDPYELHSFTPHYILAPDEIERDVHQLILSPRQETRNGTVVDVDVPAAEQFLRYLQTLGDIHYMDPTGQEWLAKVTVGRKRLLLEPENGRADWAVVDTIGVDRIRAIRYWGRGPRLDDGGVI